MKANERVEKLLLSPRESLEVIATFHRRQGICAGESFVNASAAGKATLGSCRPPLGLHRLPLPQEPLLVQLRDPWVVTGEHRQCLKRCGDAIRLRKKAVNKLNRSNKEQIKTSDYKASSYVCSQSLSLSLPAFLASMAGGSVHLPPPLCHSTGQGREKQPVTSTFVLGVGSTLSIFMENTSSGMVTQRCAEQSPVCWRTEMVECGNGDGRCSHHASPKVTHT